MRSIIYVMALFSFSTLSAQKKVHFDFRAQRSRNEPLGPSNMDSTGSNESIYVLIAQPAPKIGDW